VFAHVCAALARLESELVQSIDAPGALIVAEADAENQVNSPHFNEITKE